MVAVVGWHHGYDIPEEDLEKPEALQRREFKQHALSITRYVDLGPIAAHGVTPEWFTTHRREEMLATEYDVTPEGHWRYTGRGGAKSDSKWADSFTRDWKTAKVDCVKPRYWIKIKQTASS